MITQEQFDKWKSWITRIESDIRDRLIMPLQVHRSLVSVIEGNIEHINQYTGWHFINHVMYGFATQVAVGIRRHIKGKDDSVSLMRLLRELTDKAEYFTYSFFLSQFPLETSNVNWQEGTYRRFSDDLNVLSTSALLEDIANLKSMALTVESMVDKDIAHLDRKPNIITATYGDFERCINLLDQLVCKYRILLGKGGMQTLEPICMVNWQEIFTVPLDARTSERGKFEAV